MNIKIIVTHDGKVYRGEIDLVAENKGRLKLNQNSQQKNKEKKWYKTNSTTEKIIKLIDDGLFDKHVTISDVVDALKTKDYHLNQSDLTPSLRLIIRRNILKRSKIPDSKKSNQWKYIKS